MQVARHGVGIMEGTNKSWDLLIKGLFFNSEELLIPSKKVNREYN